MDRKPGKRRLTWFGNNRPSVPNSPYPPSADAPPKTPNTLGKMWQQEPRGRDAADSWLVREPQTPDVSSPRQPGWEPLSNLPELPPVLEDNGFRARSEIADRYNRLAGDSSTNEHAAPLWGQPDIPTEATTPADTDVPADIRQDRSHDGRLRALWWNVAARLRRPRLALAVVAGVLALCLILGVAALSNAIGNAFQGEPNSAHGVLGAGSATATAVASPSAGHATPGATATTSGAAATAAPGSTQPPTPLTIAFTCASGVIGGTGKVCVHTLPHASLTLAVRYCDGSTAKGKAFHGVSYADSGGNYTWNWTVTTTCAGAATATVTATSAGHTITSATSFTVTR